MGTDRLWRWLKRLTFRDPETEVFIPVHDRPRTSRVTLELPGDRAETHVLPSGSLSEILAQFERGEITRAELVSMIRANRLDTEESQAERIRRADLSRRHGYDT